MIIIKNLILSEEKVYIGTKNFLLKNNFVLLGGQPPRGTDALPVIEVKTESNTTKGSKHSYKPDLVAYKDPFFYIVECKPTYCKSDVDKLKSILDSEDRIYCFYSELKQRNILNNINYSCSFDDFKSSIKIVISYSGPPVIDTTVSHIVVKDFLGNAYSIK